MERTAGVTAEAPRLAVVSDVCLERTGGGSLLLYRLLEEYPADRLLVIFNARMTLGQEYHRPGVAYHGITYNFPRWIRNRFNPTWPVLMSRYARRSITTTIESRLREFAPEAILTVPHWYIWFAASTLAERLRIPLHLVLHDDWPAFQTLRREGRLYDAIRWGCRRELGRVYRQAATRLAVSPGMQEQYEKWFGVPSTILYPSRGDDSPPAELRVNRERTAAPVVAFCGWIHQDGAVILLRQLADVLAGQGGRLDLYTKISNEQLLAMGLAGPAIRHAGFFPAREMGERVAATASALFVPASFEPRERQDISTLFPSKIADYTAIGLPILIWGPAYSSAARWVADFPGAAVCVTDPDPNCVAAALRKLFDDAAYAATIAQSGLEAGEQCFTLAAARKVFFQAIASGRQ